MGGEDCQFALSLRLVTMNAPLSEVYEFSHESKLIDGVLYGEVGRTLSRNNGVIM